MTGTKGVTRRKAVGACLALQSWIFGCLVALLGTVPLLAGAPAHAATTTQAAASAQWLLAQLREGSGLMTGVAPGVPDVGVTSDTLLGLAAAGRASDPEFAVTTRAIATHLTGYAAFPSGRVTALLAGPIAKTLLVAEVGGADPSAFGGWNLPATLHSMLTTTGPNSGRFSDQFTGQDSSNGFSQVFAVLGLVRIPAGVPSAAVDFLLRQQCPSGGFRLFYDSSGSCRTDAEQDTDATALSVQALTALQAVNPGDGAIFSARARAVGWLAALQDANGGLSGTGPTKGDNANTTALGAVAFREAGLTSAALAAENYVGALQLTTGSDAGAVAYNASTLALTRPGGTIPGTSQDQWRRTTSQAILAFGLPGYNALQARAGAPIPPPATSPATPPAAPPSATNTDAAPAPAPTQPTSAVPAPPAPAGDDPYLTGGDPADGSDSGEVPDDSSAGSPPAAQASAGGQRQALPPQVAASPAPTLTNTRPTAAAAAQGSDNSTPEGFWVGLAIVGGIGAGALFLRFQPARRRSP